jgi:hypothetical protein
VDHFPYRMIGEADYERLLARADMKILASYGSWAGEPYDRAESHHLIIVAGAREGMSA